MINSVCLTGRLTKEPELKRTQTDKKVLSFTLAVSQGKENTDFINCQAWNKTAETMAKYLHKGSLIGVEGRIQTRNYENQQGQRIFVTEVLVQNFSFLESQESFKQYQQKNEQHSSDQQQQQVQPQRRAYQQPNMNHQNATVDDYATDFNDNDTLEIATDDLPF